MRTRKPYVVLVSTEVIDLEEQVRDHIKDGYLPCGGVCAHIQDMQKNQYRYYQAMLYNWDYPKPLN